MTASAPRALVAGPALLAAAAVGLQVMDPLAGEGIPCPFHALTGLHCPGCGMTRAAALLLRGDLAGALQHNVLLVPTLIGAVAWWVHALAPDRTRWLPGVLREPASTPATLLRAASLVLVLFAVVRNLPAFEVLAPPID